MALPKFDDLDDVQRWADQRGLNPTRYALGTLQSGWAWTGGTDARPGWYQTDDGVVELVGEISQAAAPAAFSTIMAVPVGIVGDSYFTTWTNNANQSSWLQVTKGGLLRFVAGGNLLSLNGVRFRI